MYHAPPDASPTSWTGKRHYGDEDLVKWIDQYQPAVVLCGHVHESPFATGGSWIDRIGATVVLNAGRQRGPFPPRIEIDTDTGDGFLAIARRTRRAFVRGRLVVQLTVAVYAGVVVFCRSRS